MKNHILVVLLLVGASAAAAEMGAVCPLVLDPAAVEIVRPPDRWVGFITSPMRLTSGGMMLGPPESMTYLVPHESKIRAGDSRQTWRFERVEEQKWLWCAYGGTRSIQLSQRLDDRVTECVLTSKGTKASGISLLSLICK